MRTWTTARRAPMIAAALALGAATALGLPAVAKDTKDAKSNSKNKPSEVGSVDASGTYQLSAEELAYDCKRLSGRMQIRLLEVRSYDPSQKSSTVARAMQGTLQPVVGVMLGKSSGHSADPDRRHANDIAMLKAYNAQLAAKKCRTFDLDAELGGGQKSVLPSPQPPPTSKK